MRSKAFGVTAMAFCIQMSAVAYAQQTPAPSQGSDVLGAIQSQVSSIFARTNSCVVTIEDLRGIEAEDLFRMAIAGRRRGLRHQTIDAFNRKSEAELRLYLLNKSIKPSPSAVASAQKAIQAIDSEIDTLKADITRMPQASRTRVDVWQGHLDALTAEKAKVDAEITQLGPTLKPGGTHAVQLQHARTFLQTQVQTVQAELAVYRQKFEAEGGNRFEVPKVGAGFSIGEGLVVTTADVLDGMSEPIIITSDGSRLRSQIVGMDNETNIGMVRLVAATQLATLNLANSDTVTTGNFAICIGSQPGSFNTVALNTVAAIRSEGMFSGRRFYPRLFQVSGASAAGISGSPILNSAGEVVGMIVAAPMADNRPGGPFAFQPNSGTALGGPGPGGPGIDRGASPGQGTPNRGRGPGNINPGIGFGPDFRFGVPSAAYALPTNNMKPVLEDLKAGKKVEHCWIGMSVVAHLSHDTSNGKIDLVRNVVVSAIYPDSPAQKVGVRTGDQVLSINGRPVKDEVDVRIVSMLSRPGDPLTIELMRPAGQASSKLTLSGFISLRPTTIPRPMETH